MALFDQQLMFSVAQDLAQAANTYNSTNVIDLGVPGTPAQGSVALIRNPGRGYIIKVEARIVEAFTSGGSATLTVNLVTSAATNLGTPTTLATSGSLALAALTLGAKINLEAALDDNATYLRYLGLQYVIGTATTTAGKVTAGLLLDTQTSPSHLT